MAESQYPYAYNAEDQGRLTRSLTDMRLGKYLSAAGFHFEFAMDMYLWNARIAKSLQFPLHVMEVTLRNAICEHLALRGASEDWAFHRQFVDSLSRKDSEIGVALNRSKWRLLRDRMKAEEFAANVRDANLPFLPSFGLIHTNDVVANMSLDFWVASMGKAFENDWHQTLRTVFPNIPAGVFRKEVERNLVTAKKMRNRIAHHEPIFHLPQLVDTYRNAVDMVSFRCRATSDWIRHHSTFLSVWHAKPQPGRHVGGMPILQFAHRANVVTDRSISMADFVLSMNGKRRDFAVVQGEDGISLIIADDITRWLAKSAGLGLADLGETLERFLNENSLASRVALFKPTATTGQARALFSSKNTPSKDKPTAIVVTSDGTLAGTIEGVVFKPDLS